MNHLKESRLPKGLKWTDPCVITKQEKNLVNSTIQFYPYGNDLYIKGLYLIYSKDKDGKHHHKKPVVVLNSYRQYTAIQVCVDYDFCYNPLLQSIICSAWHDLGLRQGYTEPILRDFELQSKKSLEEISIKCK